MRKTKIPAASGSSWRNRPARWLGSRRDWDKLVYAHGVDGANRRAAGHVWGGYARDAIRVACDEAGRLALATHAAADAMPDRDDW